MKPYAPRGSAFHDPAREVPRPVFGIDIDGTLGDFHEHFTNFAEQFLGKDLPSPGGFNEGSFASHLGLSKRTYRKIKLAYRRGGLKRSMPVFDGASDFTGSLRKRGAVVLLCTTRPYLSLETVDDDTRHWAKRNRIQHDGIAWGPNKYLDLSRLGDRVVAGLDDEPEMIGQGEGAGIRMGMMEAPYNDPSLIEESFYFFDLYEAKTMFLKLLDEWESEHR